MKRILNIALFFSIFGCNPSSVKSLLNEQVVVVETLDGTSFGDLFDAVPSDVKSDFIPFQYAQPVCRNQSSCQISLPNGSSYSLDDLQNMITAFDGNIKITTYNYEALPKSMEYDRCNYTNCWGPPISTGSGGTGPGETSPGSPGGQNPGGGSGTFPGDDFKYNPSNMNASDIAQEDTRRRVKWAEDQIQNGKNTPQGMGDIPLSAIPDVTYDNTTSQNYQDYFNKQNTDFQNSMQAEAQRREQEAQTAQGILIAAITMATNEFNGYQKIKNDHKARTDELSKKAKNAVNESNFQNAESKLNDLSNKVGKAKTNRAALASAVREKLPAVNSPTKAAPFKTDSLSVVGQAVRRADSYLGYVERSLGNYPTSNEGRIVADQLMKDSRNALKGADGSYANGNAASGDSGLRFAYALADAALALGPVALLAGGPAGVVAAIGVEALNIAKNWYEYRSGKSLWTGEPISQYQKNMAMANVVLGFVPAAAQAGLGIVAVFNKGTVPAREVLTAGKATEEVVDISASINNAEKIVDTAKKIGLGVDDLGKFKNDPSFIDKPLKDLVGDGPSIPKSTQAEVDPLRVDKYISDLKAGNKIEPIEVFVKPDGSKVIVDGHHRYVASRITGIEVPTIESPGMISGMSWADVEFKNLFLE